MQKKARNKTGYFKMTHPLMNELIDELRDKELLKAVKEGRRAIRKGTMGISFKAGLKKEK